MKVLVVRASPHLGGVTEQLANFLAAEVQKIGCSVQNIALRDYHFAPCQGCGACRFAPHTCVLATDKADRAEEVFRLLLASDLLVWCAPIYFYALPAHCKALIDRSQRLWQAQAWERDCLNKNKPAFVLLVAGRKQGKQLFSGALLTLKYFFAVFGFAIKEQCLLRGLDTSDNNFYKLSF